MFKIMFKYFDTFTFVHAILIVIRFLFNKYILLSILSHKISARIQDCIQEEGKEGAPCICLE